MKEKTAACHNVSISCPTQLTVHWQMDTRSNGSSNILDVENSLRLDDHKVDELVDVSNEPVDSVTGDGHVLARAQLGHEAVVKEELACNFGSHGDTEGHPRQLEGVTGDVNIAADQNESNGRDEGNG